MGIEDLRRHFSLKRVRARGDLKRDVDAVGVGNPLITFTLTVQSLDQVELISKK